MGYEPLHHKYRPQTFADLVGQEAIATTLTNAIKTQRIAPAYLLTGARGTGKTSTARIMAKSLNCRSYDVPTPTPCGKCDLCHGVTVGNALDITEIDAASNTGVDNIRELIERAQFAPVQARYKVYAIDECLTGESLVLTSNGYVRIDDPTIKGKKVLSYNDALNIWEYKKVLRWLDRGLRQTLTIKTANREIDCTANHLIRTNTGWIQAKNVKEGMKILSPVPVVAEFSQWTTNLEEVELVTVNKTERVYDIEVEGNHNFVANGLLVHNCHMLSTAAFNALLKTLEEPPDRVVFILATTDPQRVLPTIISRCQRFDFRRIPLEAMVSHLQKIADIESIPIQLEAITLVSQIAQGGLRDAESLLDQLSLLEGEITTEAVWDLVGSVPERDLLALLEAIAQDNSTQILEQVRRIMDRGREPLIVLQSLAGFYRDLLIAKTASDRRDLVALTATSWERLQQLAASLPISHILAGQQHLRGAEVQIKNTTQPRLWLEVTLLGLLPSAIAAVNDATPRHAVALPTPTSTPTASPSTASKPTPTSPTSDASSVPIPLNSQPSQTTALSISTSIPENNFPVAAEPPTEISIKTSTETMEHAPSLTADLEASWQELVSILLPAARGLLAEHGRFVEVTQTTVTIGLKNSALKKIAEPKRDEIAKSCEKVFKRPMQVVFAVIGSKATAKKTMTASPSAAPSITPSITPSATANLDVEPSPQPSVVLASHAKIDRPISTPSSGGTYPIENRTAPAQPDSPISNPPTGYIAKSPEELAIRNIAEFFNGQIVNWDDEPSDESSSDRQKSS